MARRTGLHSTSRSLAALVLSVVVIPATVLVVAVAERERIPVAAAPIASIPPLPAAPSDRAAGLALEALPIVEGSTDAAGAAFLDRYEELDLADLDAAVDIVLAAWDPLAFGSMDELITRTTLAEETANNLPSGQERASLEKAAREELQADPNHARHLNDLAIALFALGVSTQDDEFGEPFRQFAGGGYAREPAYDLLRLGVQAFPDDRALTLNLAWLASASPGYLTEFEAELDPVATLGAFVDRHPDDVTARLLLAHLQSVGDSDEDLERALRTLDPLAGSSTQQPVARLARGDAMLAHAETRLTESPMLARRLAGDALSEYDEAAAAGGVPDAYAGRALALDILGDLHEAIEAQQAAVELNPDSAVWWLRLAELQGCAGDQAGREASARRAIEADEGSPPRLGSSRLIRADPTEHILVSDRGFGGYALGSGRPALGVIWPEPQGTGVVIDIDPFGTPPSCMPLDETEPQISAVEEAMLAALARGDSDGAGTLFDQHWRGRPSEARLVDLNTVANLLENFSTDDDAVDALLATQDRLDPAVAGPLCDAILRDGSFSTATLRTFEVGPTLGACVAESAWRAGDEEAAHAAMQQVITMDDGVQVDGLSLLQAGMVAELIGATDEARAAYSRAAANPATIVGALARLGDLAVTEGDPASAVALYDLVLAVVDQGAGQALGDALSLPEVRAAVQHVHNNRSVAILVAADAQSRSGLDCAADADPCDRAKADVEAALESDPGSWIYQMNAGYVARLRGDDEAAERYLAEALTGEPSTAWAIHNDLGVLDAERGALDDARDQLGLAIAARPDYPLGPWNRGVLEASSGPLGFLAGQGWLADAARLQRGLRSAPTEYRFDEAVFRIELRRGRAEGVSEIPPPAGLAAAAFASVAAVGSLARLGAALVAPGREAAMSLTKRALVGKKRRLRSAERLWLGARRLGIAWLSWFVWLPALVVLGLGIVYGAYRTAPDAIVSGLIVGAGTVALALVTHQAGHRLVGAATATRVRPARWDAGLITGIGALIFQSPTGPFPAEAIAGRDRGRVWLVALAGILANCVAAAVAYALWWVEPLPVLRSLVITQLMVAAYFLIPTKPLDGARLEDRPLLTAGLGFAIAAASIALAIGVA